MIVTTTVLIFLVGLVIFKAWFKLTTASCTTKARIDGKVVIITGGTAGIGKITAQELMKRGAKKMVITGRDTVKGNKVAEEIQASSNNTCEVEFYGLDLAYMQQVKAFSEYLHNKFDHIDILVNNAGGMVTSKVITSEGLEYGFAGNYLGHFLLTHLLIPLLQKSSFKARIINVSSMAHTQYPLNFDNLNCEQKFNKWEVYCKSKLAQVYHTRKLARILSQKNANITINSLHPGVIQTEFTRYFPRTFLHPIFDLIVKTPYEGTQTTLHCCLEPDLDSVSGVYFEECKPNFNIKVKNEELENKLYNWTRKILNIDDKQE